MWMHCEKAINTTLAASTPTCFIPKKSDIHLLFVFSNSIVKQNKETKQIESKDNEKRSNDCLIHHRNFLERLADSDPKFTRFSFQPIEKISQVPNLIQAPN